MERIRDLIKEYLLNTIQTKRNMRKRIYQLEADLKEARENERYAIGKWTSYKKLNKQYRQKITELKQSLQEYCIAQKEYEKEIKKLKRKEK